ncbi:MAG: putative surface-exposed virulence protein [Acidimicrobiaceae bacterium]
MIYELTDQPATRRIAIASVALLLFAGIVAVATHKDGGVGDARLTTKGRAAVTSLNGQRREVTGTVALHRGEIVEAVEDSMTIELPDGSHVEGRPSFSRSDATRVKVAVPVELLAGDLLVTATGGTDVDAGGNRVHLDPGADGPSAARVSRALAVGAYIYRGTAMLDSAGQARAVSALREIEVSALGRPPVAPRPLQVHEGDPWDRRFLGEAIDLGHILDRYSDTYTKTLGTGNGRTAGFYTAILPSLARESAFTGDLLASTLHPPGDTIVGGAIAGLSRRAPFPQRWRDVFTFKDAGASWGLVALDQGVARDPLLSEVQNALNATPFQFAQAARTPPTATSAPLTGGPTSTPTTPSGGGTTTTQPNPPPPPTTLLPVPPTGSPLVDGLVSDVNQLLGGVVGGRPPGG